MEDIPPPFHHPIRPMTAEQVQHFRAHGYLAVPTFFDARETAAIRVEVERLKREGYLRNVATDGDGRTTSRTIHNLQLCPMYRQSPLFRALPFPGCHLARSRPHPDTRRHSDLSGCETGNLD